MYKPKYFKIKELVNPEILKKVPENTLWQMFDDRLLMSADIIREKCGVLIINTGTLTDCGVRDWTSTTGAKYSAHKFFRALDGHIQSIEKQYAGNKAEKIKAYNKVRETLMADPRLDCLNFENKSKEYPNGIPWLHFDTYNRPNRLFSA